MIVSVVALASHTHSRASRLLASPLELPSHVSSQASGVRRSRAIPEKKALHESSVKPPPDASSPVLAPDKTPDIVSATPRAFDRSRTSDADPKELVQIRKRTHV